LSNPQAILEPRTWRNLIQASLAGWLFWGVTFRPRGVQYSIPTDRGALPGLAHLIVWVVLVPLFAMKR